MKTRMEAIGEERSIKLLGRGRKEPPISIDNRNLVT